ncbi:MAG: DsbA family protein [Devosia sp.]|nr:DsbA family protein [Devosia sp.]
MSRLSFALVLLVGLLAGGLGSLVLRPQAAPLSDTDVRSMITEMLVADNAARPVAVAELDPAKVDRLVEDYLMSDPSILQRMSDKLAETKQVAERAASKLALDTHYSDIYDDVSDVILGNPDGDVTLVELFDYNCSYCRSALPDLAALIAEDPNLKVILKEFPILSAGSVDAARIAVLVGEDPKLDYWDFHQKLFSARGQVGADEALQVAEEVGGNRVALMIDMNGGRPAAVIQKTYDLAKALDISGTPTYILGDEMIPGAIGIDQLRTKIANMRACGSTLCTGDEPASSG